MHKFIIIVIFMFVFVQVKAMEITYTVRGKERGPLLLDKMVPLQKACYLQDATKRSFSYNIIHLPKEISDVIFGKLFALDNKRTAEDECLMKNIYHALKNKKLSPASVLRLFCVVQYPISFRFGSIITQVSELEVEDLGDDDREKLSKLSVSLESSILCCNQRCNIGCNWCDSAIVSQKEYELLQDIADKKNGI